jgi:hypothetical protein
MPAVRPMRATDDHRSRVPGRPVFARVTDTRARDHDGENDVGIHPLAGQRRCRGGKNQHEQQRVAKLVHQSARGSVSGGSAGGSDSARRRGSDEWPRRWTEPSGVESRRPSNASEASAQYGPDSSGNGTDARRWTCSVTPFRHRRQGHGSCQSRPASGHLTVGPKNAPKIIAIAPARPAAVRQTSRARRVLV